jgi:hypothetical protein
MGVRFAFAFLTSVPSLRNNGSSVIRLSTNGRNYSVIDGDKLTVRPFTVEMNCPRSPFFDLDSISMQG